MPSIKITYGPMKGLAEPSRLALTVGGIEFEDERLGPEEREELKKKGFFPFGSIPVITIDGKTYAQSAAMLRYCGKLSGLYPDDPLEALLVDGVIDALSDVIAGAYPDESEKARKAFVEEIVPKFFGPIDKMIGESNGPFLLGEKMTIADLRLYVTDEILSSGYVNLVPKSVLDEFKNVKALSKAVGENKKIATWNAEHA